MKEPRPKIQRLQKLQTWRTEDDHWEKPFGTILIIADNQAMAEILNGNQVYQGGDKQAINILISTTRSLSNILKLGWKTKDTCYDLIQWRERRWNKVADELCNQAIVHLPSGFGLRIQALAHTTSNSIGIAVKL